MQNKVVKYEDMVDNLEEELREKHIERLSRQLCNPTSGVAFLDIISNLERISDHAYNPGRLCDVRTIKRNIKEQSWENGSITWKTIQV